MKNLITLLLILLCLFTVAACNKHSDVPSKYDTGYTVIETHASFDDKNMDYHPATYVIRHGDVLFHVHCYSLIRREGHYDNCGSFPDPTVPLGISLPMNQRGSDELDWRPAENLNDGVAFAIDSQEVIDGRRNR